MMETVIEFSVVMALLSSSSGGGLSGVPTSINLTDGRSSKCYVWTDPFKENEKPLAPANYPVQTTFFAKKAISGKCTERHHFQIFYKKPITNSSGKVFKNTLTSAFCREKARDSLKFNDLPNYVYAANVGTKKEGFHSACLLAGSVTLGSKSKTYYFEELFESRIRSVSKK
jgi:hypothetical protein